MHSHKLQLIPAHESAHAAVVVERTPVERVFDHWVFMLGKRRAALGPTRRKAIEKMLALYDEDTLLLAVEGCAASAWHAGDNDRGQAFDDLELILRDEAHVERFAADGDALRERVRRRAEAADKVVPIAAPDADALAAARERVREAAARAAGRRRNHG